MLILTPESVRNIIKKKDRVEIAKMVVVDCLSFSFPSGDGFVFYINRNYNPIFKGVPKSTCRTDVIDLYKKYRFFLRYLFFELNCRVSVTSDFGLTINKLGIFTLTCHWVDHNWVMQKRIIAFKFDEDRQHTGKLIAIEILDCL